MSDIGFISASVTHGRLRPARNSFRYRVPYLALAERALAAPGSYGLISVDRGNLFSVRNGDYGHDGVAGAAWVRQVLQQWQLHEADGELVLVTMPRVLGLAFNPVSFWFAYDKAGAVRAVVAEVNNTFGERHFYICRHGDHRAIAAGDRIVAEKVFHVSPFMKVEGHYEFAFSLSGDRFGVRIDLHDAEGLILTTSMSGRRVPATRGRLLRAFAGNPLLMLKVLGLIHYQAVKLWAKGVANFRKPPPPRETVTG